VLDHASDSFDEIVRPTAKDGLHIARLDDLNGRSVDAMIDLSLVHGAAAAAEDHRILNQQMLALNVSNIFDARVRIETLP
jgi:hypothetical protein